jgi:hypothetical protein
VNAAIKEKVADVVALFKSTGRIVIVGASLAGLRAAEALREEGFTGKLTIIGDEPEEAYDRPPLSKQVLEGWVPADHTKLPRKREVDAEWRLGIAAAGLDRRSKKATTNATCDVPTYPTTAWWSATWCSLRSVRSATPSGWMGPGWPPASGVSVATRAVAPSISTAW